MRTCKGEIYKKMKEYIFQEFLNNLENINNIIELIDSLEKGDKDNFFEKLMEVCKFTKDEFYSKDNNTKIELICELYEKGKLKANDGKYYYKDDKLIKDIYDDLEGKIEKKKLEEFLNNKKEIVVKRLNLIKIIYSDFNPGPKYLKLKETIDSINNDVKQLTLIKNSLLIFHREQKRDDINKIIEIIKEIQEKSIKTYDNLKKQEDINNLLGLNSTCERVNKVQDFLLFKVIFDDTKGNNQALRFDSALYKLDDMRKYFSGDKISAKKLYSENKKIFDIIKELLSNSDERAEILIKKIKDYFNINKNEEFINDLEIIIKSKKYENDLKSIIYFFESFPADTKWSKKLPNDYETLSKKDLDELKKDLNKLDKDGIYNYKKSSEFSKFFTSFYEKEEAIEFLLSKVHKDKEIAALYEKYEPTNRTISIENIKDAEFCIKKFEKFKNLNDNFKIFNYIKTELKNEEIEKFVRYSKNYSSIIELERNIDFSGNVYEQVNNIVTNAILIFRQDYEDFSFGEENKKISMIDLMHLKNKIPPLKKGGKKVNKSNEIIEEKRDKLIFFKEIISNLEIIYDNMNILRKKGCSLPIQINILIIFPEIFYKINKEEKNFEQIQDFLFKAKTDYTDQLESIYKQKKYLRFLYGKLFRRIMIHLDNGNNVDEILRFILNNTNNNEKIIDGDILTTNVAENYVEQYREMTNNSFKNISDYMTSLFKNNETSLQKHYEKMLIKDKNIYKGIYLK